jgi:hypothetical protein
MSIPRNANERIIARIDAVYDRLSQEDDEVLTYVRSQLSPAGMAQRDEWDRGVDHLREVADQRLKPYEQKEHVEHS